MKSLQAAGVPAGAVLDNTELLSDPQLNARGFFTELHHPQAGTHRYPGLPFAVVANAGCDRSGRLDTAARRQTEFNLAQQVQYILIRISLPGHPNTSTSSLNITRYVDQL